MTPQFDGTDRSEAVASGPPDAPDQAATINAEMESLRGRNAPWIQTLSLPGGPLPIQLDSPIVLRGSKLALSGGRHIGTNLNCRFLGSAVVSQAPRPPFALGDGPFQAFPGVKAMQTGPGKPWLDLSKLPTLDLSGKTAATWEYWIYREQFSWETLSHPWASQINLGPIRCWESTCLRETPINRVRVMWGNVYHDTPNDSLSVGAWDHVAKVLHQGNVLVFINGVLRLQFPSPTPTVPQTPGGVETIAACGDQPNPISDTWRYGQSPGRWTGLRVSDVARYTESFLPPRGPFTGDGHTLLLINFDQPHPDFVVAGWGAGGKAYLPIKGNSFSQIGHVRISDLRITGAGASGFYLRDTFNAELMRLRTEPGTWQACESYGTCFENEYDNLFFYSNSHGFVGGANSTIVRRAKLFFNGIGLFLDERAAGWYDVFLSPQNKAIASAYIRDTANVNLANPIIDDEGAAASAEAGFILHSTNSSANGLPAMATFFGGQVGVARQGKPVFDCSGGAWPELYGTSYFCGQGAPRICNFRDPPRYQPVCSGVVPLAPYATITPFGS